MRISRINRQLEESYNKQEVQKIQQKHFSAKDVEKGIVI